MHKYESEQVSRSVSLVILQKTALQASLWTYEQDVISLTIEVLLFERSLFNRIIIKLFQMSRQLGSLEDSYHTPLRRTNDLMTRSQFLTNSTVHSTNPEIVRHSFFKDQPFQRFRLDRSKYRPVSNHSPNKAVHQRNYVIVDQTVNYGNAISQAQLDRIIGRRTIKPEIITYGLEDYKPTRVRQTIEVKKESGKTFCGCCGVDDRKNNDIYVSRYN